MHRVLKPGGATLIIDMRKDAADSAVDAYVDKMNTSRFNRLITRWTFNHVLRKRAYSMKEITEMVAATSFESCAIGESGLGMEISLRK
jgi:ubiquinone/menaquinone biosynthesis C-methylase UbiE